MPETDIHPVHVTSLKQLDSARLALADREFIPGVAMGLTMQGRGETAIEPRIHLAPRAKPRRPFRVELGGGLAF